MLTSVFSPFLGKRYVECRDQAQVKVPEGIDTETQVRT